MNKRLLFTSARYAIHLTKCKSSTGYIRIIYFNKQGLKCDMIYCYHTTTTTTNPVVIHELVSMYWEHISICTTQESLARHNKVKL